MATALLQKFRRHIRLLYRIDPKISQMPKSVLLSHAITSLLTNFSSLHRPTITARRYMVNAVVTLYVMKMRHYQAEVMRLVNVFYVREKKVRRRGKAALDICNQNGDVYNQNGDICNSNVDMNSWDGHEGDIIDSNMCVSDAEEFRMSDPCGMQSGVMSGMQSDVMSGMPIIVPVDNPPVKKIRYDKVTELSLSDLRVDCTPRRFHILDFSIFGEDMPEILSWAIRLRNDGVCDEVSCDFTGASSLEEWRGGSMLSQEDSWREKGSNSWRDDLHESLEEQLPITGMWIAAGVDKPVMISSLATGSRERRAAIFYKILELACDGKVALCQEMPFVTEKGTGRSLEVTESPWKETKRPQFSYS